jgi:FkbM family methyltransferase
MDALYANFVGAEDLVFDIGAHVGDRVSSFRRLGARVVAVEPQPLLMRALQHIHGRDPHVLLVPGAAGDVNGEIALHINSRNPTVSTVSDAFLIEAGVAAGWQSQTWDKKIRVPMVSLDRLISVFGPPRFIKIDVEGFEDCVLTGLSQPVPALSFEFTTIARDVALRCLQRLTELAAYRFNLALGESQKLVFEHPIEANDMAHHLRQLPHEANSGDVYAIAARQG